MNEVIKIKSSTQKPTEGQIYENDVGIYLLGRFENKYFLVNLETGSTWNGFKDNIDMFFLEQEEGSFRLISEPIKLTPL